LTVRGNVLGALNVDFSDVEDQAGIAEEIVSMTAQAAPVVANLRSLAMAEKRAATDWLTELPNRGQFEEALERAVSHAHRHGRPVSLAMLDLDGFKSVNDTYGHEQGDLVLRATGDAISRGLRVEDFAARIGGDEFAIIFVEATVDGARTAAGRVRGLLSKSSLTPGVRRAITASIGIASLPEDATDTPGLLRAADTALYAAKAEGGDAISCFSETRAGGAPID
jgi:diguanylate cyclase (GGDEF)-like protein